ncbi:MAG: hypothetical protein KGZ25_02355 [Planctomycetes bacterium]|nr:hypothetical protein [Planctomycetota bacterium]
MYPRERLLNALQGKPADRVPLFLQGFHYTSREELEELENPRKREIAERIFDETTYRFCVPSYVNRYLVTPPQRMRSEREELNNGNVRIMQYIDTPKGELKAVKQWDANARTSWQEKYPVENKEDIEKIASVPWERADDLKPIDLDEAPEDFERRGIAATHVSSPMVCVSAMMDYQWFLELAYTEEDLILELTDICRQRILDLLKGLFEQPGIEYVWMGGSEWVTPPMGSPDMYDKYVQGPEESIISHLHENTEAFVHVHCHGCVRHALKRMIERGADYTEPVEPPPDGDITMEEAKEMAAGRITLGGNIEARVLCNEDEGTVEQAVRDAFKGGKERFVLRPTEGPTPAVTEREYRNYMRLLDVWEELSPIG